MSGPQFRLCLILTRALCRRTPLEVLRASVAGGADLVQLREKELAAAEFAVWAAEALRACRALGVPLVVNDSVEIARAVGADGAHLGQEDLPPTAARRILGPGALLGWSTHDAGQLARACALFRDGTISYAGFGPAFPTATKGLREGLGPEAVRAAAAQAAAAGLPLLAIGGISVENRARLGEKLGIAVCSALCSAPEPEASARALLA